MITIEKVRFLAENFLFKAALEELLANQDCFTVRTTDKAAMLNKHTPGISSLDYPIWVAAVEKFFKTV